MLLIYRTKTDGAPAGNNLIKWLLKHEQIVPKERKYFYVFFKNREGRKNYTKLDFFNASKLGFTKSSVLKTKCLSLSAFFLNYNKNCRE